jgi:hypothetical protein
MHGLQKYLNSNYLLYCFISFTLTLLISGCKGSETSTEKKSASGFKRFLVQYEKTFKPSDYDDDVSMIKALNKKFDADFKAASIVTIAVPETISGFRVQILSTQEIDQANLMKDSVSRVFFNEWVYLVFDSPYYKIRIGNFTNRITANQTLKEITNAGFINAWIVPDNVLKIPPPRPPETFIEPERPIK